MCATLMAKEGIALEKSLFMCELEAHHKVDLGHAYQTAPSAKSFMHYIVQAQREQFRGGGSSQKEERPNLWWPISALRCGTLHLGHHTNWGERERAPH